MLGTVARSSNLLGRNVMKGFVRNGSRGGTPGENLPFDIHNKKWLTWNFLWFGVTGIGAPFLILHYQLKKSST